MSEGHAILVCGYGCHLSQKLRDYLLFVARYAKGCPDATVVVSGGFTNRKTAPGVSEAKLMKDFLVVSGVTNRIVMDEKALTTLDNVRFAIGIIINPEQSTLTILCDGTRALKVRLIVMARIRVPVRIVPFDFGRSMRNKVFQYMLFTPVEVAAMLIPLLENRMRRFRERLNQGR